VPGQDEVDLFTAREPFAFVLGWRCRIKRFLESSAVPLRGIAGAPAGLCTGTPTRHGRATVTRRHLRSIRLTRHAGRTAREASLFAAFDLASGSVIAQHYRRHRNQEFLRFLKLIDAAVPKDLELHLVLDNYATHKTPAIHHWLLSHPASTCTSRRPVPLG